MMVSERPAPGAVLPGGEPERMRASRMESTMTYYYQPCSEPAADRSHGTHRNESEQTSSHGWPG